MQNMCKQCCRIRHKTHRVVHRYGSVKIIFFCARNLRVQLPDGLEKAAVAQSGSESPNAKGQEGEEIV